jgi:hypothetical protein
VTFKDLQRLVQAEGRQAEFWAPYISYRVNHSGYGIGQVINKQIGEQRATAALITLSDYQRKNT